MTCNQPIIRASAALSCPAAVDDGAPGSVGVSPCICSALMKSTQAEKRLQAWLQRIRDGHHFRIGAELARVIHEQRVEGKE